MRACCGPANDNLDDENAALSFSSAVGHVVGLYLDSRIRAFAICINKHTKTKSKAAEATKRPRGGKPSLNDPLYKALAAACRRNPAHSPGNAKIRNVSEFLRSVNQATPKGFEVHVILNEPCISRDHHVGKIMSEHEHLAQRLGIRLHLAATTALWFGVLKRYSGGTKELQQLIQNLSKRIRVASATSSVDAPVTLLLRAQR